MAPSKYDDFKTLDADFEWYFVITAAAGASTLSPEYCRAVRDDFGLTMPVLIDSAEVFPDHIGVSSTNAWTMVLDGGGRITVKDKYSQSAAFGAVERLLSP